MANTVMTAKNTFAEGLIMDFSPDNTQATTLTSALNATLLTFNGNEMALQNDMGNGRVETAYLPEGYVPVGTCEFGDIIYIVSYNPIINKSQIGCFPSPERNISSDEVGGLGQSLKWTDFQGSNGNEPNGEIVASSVKKILYGTKDMTSGDKYIIYSDELDSTGNHEYLSDYGNTSHQHKRFPKLVKIHVVSIEESGKITYLDSSTKWYKDNHFYISNSKKIVDKPDLDSYRTMVSSAYSIFSSKVSGKLALLVELEKITGFSCTWSAYTKEVNDKDPDYLSNYQQNRYSIYWNFSWSTDNNNINPNAVVLTQSKWTGEDSTHAGQYQIWEKVDNGWVLGGENKNWKDGLVIPVAYPNEKYNYKTISRVYSPETYNGTFENFINSGSYEAQSKTKLDSVKENLGLSNIELIKANLSRKEDGTPDEGNYYFNCSSSSIDKDGKVTYYTNYENELKAITPQEMSDDIINNTFNYPIVKHFADFTIPIKQKVVEEWKNLNINNLIYYYELTPAMPYGLLREFSQDGYIDFKKIGTKSIELNSWRYYNYENTSTLTWGLEAYTEPNKGISEVVFLFYDNQGLAAAYHNSGKISYNGKFTEYFTLNTSGTNYKLNSKNEKNETFYHKGEKVSKASATISNTYLDSDGKVTSIDNMNDTDYYYLNDAGTIYSNCLYLVKIIVKYCSVGVLDEYIEDQESYIEDYRWYWTNTMFNDYYYSTQDFKGLQFSLNLDCQAVFETVKSKWEIKQVNYHADDDFSSSITSQNAFKSLSATVQFINQDENQKGNVRMAVRAGLQKDYNTFNLEENQLSNINTKIFLANEYIQNYPEQPEVKFSEKDTTIFSGIYPTLAKKLTGKVDKSTSNTLNKLVNSSITGEGDELYTSANAYQNYTNNFHLSADLISKEEGGNASEGFELVYIDSQKQDEVSTTNFTVYKTSLDKVYYDEANSRINESKSYPLTFSGIHYSKYYYYNQLDTSPLKILKSFVTNVRDLQTYSMGVNGQNKIQYTKMYFCSIREKRDAKTEYNSSIASFNTNSEGTNTVVGNPDNNNTRDINDDGDQPIHKGLSFTYDKIMDNFKFLFPLGFAYNNSDNPAQDVARKNGNVLISSNRLIRAGERFGSGDLGGTLCGISVDGVIEPGDHMQYGNSLTYFMPVVLGYLTQLFYLSSDTGQSEYYYPSNYVYLDDNYSIYGRDVVIELQPRDSTTNNELLVFRGWSYSAYLDEVISHAQLEKDLEDLKKENNVNLKLHGCLRTSPLEIKIPYITPATDIISATNMIIVNSIYSDIPRFTTQSFTEGAVYYYNPSTKQFANVATGHSLRKVSDYDIIGGESIQTSFTRNYSTFNIERTRRQLTLVNNQLALSQVPSSSTSTYHVKVTKQIRGDSSRSLTGFYSGLKYYD